METNKNLIGKYINKHYPCFSYPAGKIIGTRGKTILILARVTAKRDPSWKPEIIPGGFSGHCTNNYSQKHTYTVDENETYEIRWTPGKTKMGILRLSDKPTYFYDYNF